MFCKQLLALFLWCHCYQIVLDPLLQLLAIGLRANHYYLHNHQDASGSSGRDSLLFSYSPYVAGSPIIAEANQVALTPGHEIVLRCSIDDYPDVKFSWFRVRQYSNKETPPAQEREEQELKQIDDKYIVNNNFIVIKSPTFADVGDYYCRVQNPRPGILDTEKMITIRARPYIQDFAVESSTLRSAVVEEGKSLKIPCNVIDDYAPESNLKVTWHMSKFDENDMDDVISGEEGIRTETYNSTNHALIIDRVTKDHRRYYKCRVTNGITDNSKVLLIRVKDKYTVIWPTVGIVIELVILIGVIVVVENRKVEPDKGTYDPKAIQM